MARTISTAVIGKEVVSFDMNDTNIFHGDRAVIVRANGALAVANVHPAYSEALFGGARSAIEPQDGFSTFSGCVIIGRVVETSSAV